MTQHYCAEKLINTSKDLASILRTINPVINGKHIFDFELTHFEYLDIEYLTLSKWNLNEDEYFSDIVPNLFHSQLAIKKQPTEIIAKEFKGRILVSEYKCSVTDGASEAESQGLIDIYDLPPIDTWFYLNIKEGLLFSWIPEKYIDLINNAVLVNCVDILQWMDLNYRDLYLSIFGKETIIETYNTIECELDIDLNEKTKSSFWDIFKRRKTNANNG
ncbi:hypothetical protein [Algibacter sp. L3A6]|uniref:hypothetical protein n=1 Tax=Algibacter sp. L3A6 TaxID=2686366 RepID=UPI00131AFE20|nr:hypothetical protein [Algibacter sp. L3A6]